MNGILACPICHSALEIIAPDRLCCPEDQQEFVCVDGIWRFLPAERLAFYRRFINDYEAIRRI
jgi:uncharacterized protein YbaR (Trm112 family)